METTGHRRPLFATIICVVSALFLASWLFHMLPGHQRVLKPETIQLLSHGRWFRSTMASIDLVLSVGGIIALWFMRPIATTFFAAQIVTSVVTTVVNIFFLHSLHLEQALYANPSRPFGHPTMPEWITWALPIMAAVLTVSIRVSLFLYVWRVTSLLPRLRADVMS